MTKPLAVMLLIFTNHALEEEEETRRTSLYNSPSLSTSHKSLKMKFIPASTMIF
jgi:hypothetical protein